MTMPHHRLSREVFAALAAGEGGRAAMRELAAAEHSKHLILLRGVLASARDSGEQHRLARMGYELLAEASRADHAAAEKVIRYPSVGVWARRTIQGCRGAPALPGARPGGLRAVAAAAAIRARLPAEIEVAAVDGRVVLPSLGAAIVSGGAATVRVDDEGVHVGPVKVPESPSHDAPGWLGLRRVRMGSLDIVIDDLDPFRMPNAPDLAGRDAAEPWPDALRQVWALLEKHHPGVAAEIAAAVSVIVPRSRPSSGVASTTSPDAFGAIAMSVPPTPVTGAETLVHEMQHVKLGALLDIVTMTIPDDKGYYAPWRDDPRPLGGLFQGAYAYLGVTGFWRRQCGVPTSQPQADVKYARQRVAAALGVETLRSSGRLTSAGLDFVNGMAHVLSVWKQEQVPMHAVAEARRAAEAHLARWRSVNGPPPGLMA
jgi:HEXXH motif-containing protein